MGRKGSGDTARRAVEGTAERQWGAQQKISGGTAGRAVRAQ